ncbi:competence pheromone ComX [Paenibacillus sp. HN-1]|uniref:competence pheromone ComX n=1 Tax=Paenibacillus TaxID=44249 RepID=UPI001CA9EEC6|nr:MULTISPECIES: competence pheromone ComX [Paenibacillus]MBY9077981.1 competence pheromone ComX [Paenibacillus sp. CGMCC 1.18879]MBY9083915.1 competence pheromone ComX [Paenibacillus sinensis]
MLQEIIRKMVKEPGFLMQLKSGQLQLAGMSALEERAFMDVMNSRGKDNDPTPLRGMYWC